MCLDLKLVGGKVVIFGDKQTNGQGALLYRLGIYFFLIQFLSFFNSVQSFMKTDKV